MKEIIPDIDKLFLDAENQHQEVPSNKIWESIEHDLDKKKVVSITKRYDRMKWVAAILLFLLGSVSAYLFLRQGNEAVTLTRNGVINEKPTIKDATLKKDQASTKGLSDSQTIANRITEADAANGMKSPKAGEIQYDDLQSRNSGQVAKKKMNDAGGLSLKNNRPNTSDDNKNNKPDDIKYAKNNLQILGKPSSLSLNSSISADAPEYSKVVNSQPDYLKNPAFIFSNRENFLNYQLSSYNPPPMPDTKSIWSTSGLTSGTGYKKYINKKTSKGRIELSAYYSPDFIFDHLRDDKPPRPNVDRQHVKDNEQHTFSYTSGITAGLKINKALTLQAGLAFSQISIDNHPKTISAEKDSHGDVKYRFDASCGFGYFVPHSGPPPRLGDSLMGVSSHNTLQFVEIPITLKFSKQIKNISLNGVTGISINKLVSGMINTTVNNPNIKESQTISSVEGLKRYSLAGVIGGGVDYTISKSFSFSFLPTVRIALTSINNGSSVKSYPISLGLSTGFKIRL